MRTIPRSARPRWQVPLLALTAASCSASPPDLSTDQAALVDPASNITPSSQVGAVAGGAGVGATGEATYTVPIAVPPGIRGMAPSVALTYASNRGSGIAGRGWGLTASSSIQRCPRTYALDGYAAPVAFGAATYEDALCLDGERLVLIEGQHLLEGAVYLKRRNDWTRVELVAERKSGPLYFRVTTHDHRIRTYGHPGYPSRRVYQGVPYEWMLATIEDRFGNRIVYDYDLSDVPFVGAGGAVETATIEARLREIRYTESRRDDGSAVAASRFVKFFYEPRSDLDRRYYFGALRVTHDRLERIETHAPEGLVRTLRLGYDEGPATGASRLVELEECDGAGVCLPATELAYQDGGSGYDDVAPPAEQPSEPVYASDMVFSLFADRDGDGKQEMYFQTGADGLKRWDPTADFPEDVFDTLPVIVGLPDAAGGHSANGHLVFGDDDEYSHYELFHLLRTYPSAGNFDGRRGDDLFIPGLQQAASPPRVYVVTEAGYLELEVPAIAAADLDGDGFTDVFGCGPDGAWAFSLNRPSAGDDTQRELATISRSFQGLPCDANTAFLTLDVDGDGATELLVAPPAPAADGSYEQIEWTHGGFVRSTTNLPYDTFQRWRDETCQHAQTTHSFFGAEGTLPFTAGRGLDKVGDFNGDGLADILRFNVIPGAGQSVLDVVEQRFDRPPDLGVEHIESVGASYHFLYNKCHATEPDQQYGLELFINTGRGFRAGLFVWAEFGDPHVGLWQRFAHADVVDYDADGRDDLLMPFDAGGHDEWKVLEFEQGGVIAEHALGITWDTHADVQHEQTWDEWLLGYKLPTARLRARVSSAPDLNGDGRSDLLFTAGSDDPRWSTNFDVHVRTHEDSPDLLSEVTDGLGHHERFVYTTTSDERVIRGPGQVPRARRIVQALVQDAGPVGTGHDGSEYTNADHWERVTEYEYVGPVVSPYGHGLVGFETVRTTRSVRESYDADQFGLDDQWLGVTERRYDLSYDPGVGAHPRAGVPISVVTTQVVDRPGGPHALVEVSEQVHGLNGRLSVLGTPVYSLRTELSEQRTHELAIDECAVRAPYAMATAGYGDGAVVCRLGDVASSPTVTERSVDPTWDDLDNVTEVVVAMGNGQVDTTSTTYHDDGSDPWWPARLPRDVITSSTGVDGATQTRHHRFVYDFATGVPTAVVRSPELEAYRRRDSFEYTAQGNVKRVEATADDGATRSTLYTWDADGYHVAGEVSPGVLGSDIEYHTHGGLGVVTHIKGPFDVVSEATYDGFGRVTGEMRKGAYLGPSDGADTAIEYVPGSDFPGAVMQVRTYRSGGRVVTTDVDRLGRGLRSQWAGFSPDNVDLRTLGDVFVVTQYDPRGLVRRTFGPYREGEALTDVVVQRTHDGAGRLVDLHRADGAHATTTYSGGLVVSHDFEGKVSTTHADKAGMVWRTTDHDGVALCLDRGAYGNVVRARRNCGYAPGEPTPEPSLYGFDDYGRLTSTYTPETGWQVTSYNPLDEIELTLDAKGDFSFWHYDPAGRLHWIEQDDGDTLLLYHPVTGRLHQTVSPDGVVSVSEYDAYGRPVTQTTEIDGESFTVGYVYDANSRLWRVNYPTSVGLPFGVQYDYDPHGYLRSARDNAGTLLWRADRATAAGQLEGEYFGGTPVAPAMITTRSYDPVTRRLETLRTRRGIKSILHERYWWTPAGNLDAKEDLLAGLHEDYDYDDLHRLVRTTVTGPAGITNQSVAYNALGDITFKSGVGDYVYDDQTRRTTAIGGDAQVHDFNGNLIAAAGHTYTYSPRQTLQWMTTADGTEVKYDYDARGGRVRRTDSSGRSTIHVDGLYERTSRPGQIEHRYRVQAWGKTVAEVWRRDDGGPIELGTNFLHADYRGSVVLVTDETGVQLHRRAFDPWGAAVDATDWVTPTVAGPLAGVNVGFTGHAAQMDGELLNLRGRMYDPRTARFASPDPIIQAPGDLRDHNLYSYVWNRPTVLLDPSGFGEIEICAGCAEGDGQEVQEAWDDWGDAHPGEDGWTIDIDGGDFVAEQHDGFGFGSNSDDAGGDVDEGGWDSLDPQLELAAGEFLHRANEKKDPRYYGLERSLERLRVEEPPEVQLDPYYADRAFQQYRDNRQDPYRDPAFREHAKRLSGKCFHRGQCDSLERETVDALERGWSLEIRSRWKEPTFFDIDGNGTDLDEGAKATVVAVGTVIGAIVGGVATSETGPGAALGAKAGAVMGGAAGAFVFDIFGDKADAAVDDVVDERTLPPGPWDF